MTDSDDQNDGENDAQNGGIAGDLRRWRRVDGLDRLRMRLQRALKTAETILLHESSDVDERLSAARVVISAARESRKMIETVELEERLERLEDFVNGRTHANHE